MDYPMLRYDLAKLRIAEELRRAERERQVRQAGSSRSGSAIDAVPFRDRIARLFGLGELGAGRPTANAES